MEEMDRILPIMFILVIGLNALSYWIKFTLKQNGYEVSWFWNHMRDIPNIWKLAKNTDNPCLRTRYFLMASGLPIGTVIFIASFFIIVPSSMQSDPCEYAKYFKQTEWKGIVIEKYRDTPNHDYQTIEVKNESMIEKIQNWVLFQNGNYELIEIGDSISKRKDEKFVRLYKSGNERILKVDYGCNEY
jgi:hypothetical protein